jgi:dihydrofolate reductase
MTISLIVAVSANGMIGKDNALLWHLPKDLKFFKNKTWALPVVMGRKTFEALGNKPLGGRLNIVITRQSDWSAANAETVTSLEEAIALAKHNGYAEVMITGGGEIYRQSLPMAHHVYLTRVHANLDGDTSFPELDTHQWTLGWEETHSADTKHAYAFTFQRWDKR